MAINRYLALFAFLPFAGATSAVADLIKMESAADVKATMNKLEGIVTEKGFKVFARIDHAAGAKTVDQELRPTELLIFGNPAGGTPMIQAEQTMGLTLPLKVLIWQDADGKVWIGYDDVAALAANRNLAKDHPAVVKANGALEAMSGAAAK